MPRLFYFNAEILSLLLQHNPSVRCFVVGEAKQMQQSVAKEQLQFLFHGRSVAAAETLHHIEGYDNIPERSRPFRGNGFLLKRKDVGGLVFAAVLQVQFPDERIIA